MLGFLIVAYLLLVQTPDNVKSDLEVIASVADNVLDSYKIKYINQDTGKSYSRPEEFPKKANILPDNRFFDWHYTTGILNSSLLQLADLTGEEKYVEYVHKQVAYPISEWKKVNPRVGETDWNPFYGLRRYDELDFVGTQNGAIIDMNMRSTAAEYEDYIQRAAEHIRHGQQRLEDGTLVRDWPEKSTLWADDLYMGLSFMVRYAVAYRDDAMLADAVLQVDNFNKYLWCSDTGLYHHGFYGTRNTPAGYHWGRSNGWIMKATCELLDVLRPDSEEFARLQGYLTRQVENLVKYQRPDGMWCQLLDHPDSYEESSATTIFSGAIAHAVVKGWISADYAPMALKAWEYLKANKIIAGELHTVCIGTGIRNTVKEYTERQYTDTDSHGTGLVITTGMEIMKLKDMLEGRNVISARPTFVSCSVDFGTCDRIEGLELEYRKQGAKVWTKTDVLPYYNTQRSYRTSITRLEEDSAYECRLRAGSKVVASTIFFTWKSDVKVAKTIVIDPDKVNSFPIRIKESGTAQGWVKYTAPKDKVFVNNSQRPTFLVENASYVILEGMEFKGPQIHDGVISIRGSKGVRVQNCELYDFGRIAPMAFDRKGVPVLDGKPVNFDGAILIKPGSSEIVVERCYIHDSAGRSNSWRYAHPAGTEAVIMYRPDHSTVIRYNDFIGSDLHRFNDAVESQGNFNEDGGFNRDADIYGNFMIFANDDCIELDGGQRNVRCFDNRFEGSLVGISIQGCMVGPSFVFNNLISGLGEEFGLVGRGIKTGGGKHGPEARSYIYGNTWYNRCGGFDMMSTLEAHLHDNIWGEGNRLTHPDVSLQSSFENNTTNVKLCEDDISPLIPVRPCPFVLSAARKTDPQDGYTLSLCAADTLSKPQQWEIRHNNDMDWFDVVPSSGVINPGEKLTLTIRLKHDKMQDRRIYRSAFIVRTPDGMSRPFSFYCNTSFVPPFHAESKGTQAIYVNTKETSLPSNGDVICWEFKVKKPGRYYVMVRTKGMQNGYVEANVDDSNLLRTQLMAYKDHASWTILAPGKKQGDRISFYDLEPGKKHYIYMKKGSTTDDNFQIEGIVVTDNPQEFEPR